MNIDYCYNTLSKILTSKDKHKIYFKVYKKTCSFVCEIWYQNMKYTIYNSKISWDYVYRPKDMVPINLIDPLLQDGFFEMLKNDKKGLIAILRNIYNELILENEKTCCDLPKKI